MGLKGAVPRVAVAGRRNVGKSTLFNALLGRQRAITDDFSGLTRDILEEEVNRKGVRFLLSDTPGLDLANESDLEAKILERARQHLEGVDQILLLLEAPDVHPYDHFLIDFVRRNSKAPVVYAVNKIDDMKKAEEQLEEFYRIGLDPVVPISARGRWNLDALVKALMDMNERIIQGDIPDEDAEAEKEPAELSIAIVGRPNAGKSSLFNKILEREVSLVSEVPGTTRDTVDTTFQYFNKAVRIVDTAGLRRPTHLRGEKNRVEFFSAARTRRAVKNADIVVHVIDAEAGITDLDKRISMMIIQSRKPVIIAVNKWDLIPDKTDKTMAEYQDRLEFLFPHAARFPVVFLSALTGQRVKNVVDLALELQAKITFRAPIHKLNDLVAIWNRRLPKGSGKILYVTQSEATPPEFVFFVGKVDAIRESSFHFYENMIRETFELEGIPLSIKVRGREGDK